MSKTIKFVAVVLLLGFLVYHYHSEIHEFINSLPFSIPFLTDEEENAEDKGSFEYYFKDNNIQEEYQEEAVWDIYKN